MIDLPPSLSLKRERNMVKLRGPGASANISFRVLSSGALPAIETWIIRKYALCIYLELSPTSPTIVIWILCLKCEVWPLYVISDLSKILRIEKFIRHNKCFSEGMLLYNVVAVCNKLSLFVNHSTDVGMAFTFLFVRVAISNDRGLCIAHYSLYTAGVYALMVPNSSSAKSINISNIPEYTFPTAVSVYLTRRSPSNQIFWELHSLALFHVNSFDQGARYW